MEKQDPAKVTNMNIAAISGHVDVRVSTITSSVEGLFTT